ncbi:hypothetical protein [Citricoccus sp. NR2]|nr:hypothetical protein [Citricoccus sp. NR2]WBL19366.1 hypothetical protein O1A05_01245 [Citricoccus sp. NR2]
MEVTFIKVGAGHFPGVTGLLQHDDLIFIVAASVCEQPAIWL